MAPETATENAVATRVMIRSRGDIEEGGGIVFHCRLMDDELGSGISIHHPSFTQGVVA